MSDLVRRLNAHLEGDGPRTLVLANGFCTSRQSWDAVRTAVPPGWRILSFDYAGNPGTPAEAWSAARHASLHGHADDLVALLAAYDVRDAFFLGHSMGGMIGVLARLADPSRLARLALLGASPRYVDDPAAGYVGGLSQAALDDMLTRADADLAAWMAGFAPIMLGAEAAPQLVRDFAGYITRFRPDVARLMLRSILASDWRHVLPRVDCPVVLLQPARDATVPPSVGEYLARTLPRAELRVLDVASHLPHLTHPDVVRDALARLLAEDEALGAAGDRSAHAA